MAWTASPSSPLERRPLSELLQRHEAAIRELREALTLVLTASDSYVDEVWLLRYVISFPAGAVAAARRALEWRRENKALICAASARRPPGDFTADDLHAINTFYVASFSHISNFGDPVSTCRARDSNPRKLMDAVGVEKVELWLNFVNECIWQYCESETRKRGWLVKQINIQDASSVPMVQEKRFLRALGNSSKMNEWLRPQLVGRTYICNPPVWASMAFRIARNFMSKESLEKIWLHPGTVVVTSAAAPAFCPFAQQLLGEVGASFMSGRCPLAHESGFSDSNGRRQQVPSVFAGLPLLNIEHEVLPNSGVILPSLGSAYAAASWDTQTTAALHTSLSSESFVTALSSNGSPGELSPRSVIDDPAQVEDDTGCRGRFNFSSDQLPVTGLAIAPGNSRSISHIRLCCRWVQRSIFRRRLATENLLQH